MSSQHDLERAVAALQASVWANERLPALIDAEHPGAVLRVLVQEARALTDAPSVWALTFSGKPGGNLHVRALATEGDTLVPAPSEISRSIVGTAVRDQRPAWSDDAGSDARFTASESVQSFALRSVGCVPVGQHGVLYLHDSDTPGRFGTEVRSRLSALCRLAAPFLEASQEPPSPRTKVATPVEGMVGTAPAMATLYDGIRAFAPMPWPALVLGESGTGKELVARALHGISPRARRPFLAVNCGGLSDELALSQLFGHERGAFTGADRRHIGYVERVEDGTLFLDEVGELSGRVQVQLLRLLQEGTFERVGGDRELRFAGRIVAATLRPLDGDREGFRDDLFHRLASCILKVPPLRERREDIEPIAQALLRRVEKDLGVPRLDLGADAIRELRGRDWPGNVREIEQALRRAVAFAMAGGTRTIQASHLGDMRTSAGPSTGGMGLIEATEVFQRHKVREALAACEGNRTRAAEHLGVSRQWLHRLIQKWGGEP